MSDRPRHTPQDLLRDLTLPRRIGYLVAGLGGLAVAVLVGVLWATEPAPLPTRTRWAFGLVILVGLSWAGVAGWALARRPLFALDRVIAAGLALAASTLVTLATVAVTATQAGPVAVTTALLVGGLFVAPAAGGLAGARARQRALLTRARELAGPPSG
jgi:hypothetical protein